MSRSFWIAAVALFSLSACDAFRSDEAVARLNRVDPVGAPFQRYLARDYRAFANNEENVMEDYADALHFADKGLASAGGALVMPEPLNAWHLDAPNSKELVQSRARLIRMLDAGGREIAPREMARAQSQFDCWVEQQEEDFQPAHIARCRTNFMKAMQEVESKMVGLSPALRPSSPVGGYSSRMGDGTIPFNVGRMQGQSPQPGFGGPTSQEDRYMVFFDWDSSSITPAGNAVLDGIAADIKRQVLSGVDIIGHTDTSGSEQYNDKLALRRAEAVRKALVRRGVPDSIISASGRGEHDLLVPTPDGVREPSNRRASIIFD